jgi:hypothetical protein
MTRLDWRTATSYPRPGESGIGFAVGDAFGAGWVGRQQAGESDFSHGTLLTPGFTCQAKVEKVPSQREPALRDMLFFSFICY